MHLKMPFAKCPSFYSSECVDAEFCSGYSEDDFKTYCAEHIGVNKQCCKSCQGITVKSAQGEGEYGEMRIISQKTSVDI